MEESSTAFVVSIVVQSGKIVDVALNGSIVPAVGRVTSAIVGFAGTVTFLTG